jgi:uncharacterized protein (TIGR03086 family)
MTDHLDFTPAARQMASVVAGVRDEQVDQPTPCSSYSVGDLLDHIGRLVVAFTRAARKDLGEVGTPPLGDATKLGDDWRTRIPADLEALAAAWSDSEAWSGMTRAGGIDMPAEICGAVLADELLVHGWDLAKATGQDYDCDDATADVALAFYAMFPGGDDAEARGEAFGPAIDVPASASKLDRVVGLSGRNPGWTAA